MMMEHGTFIACISFLFSELNLTDGDIEAIKEGMEEFNDDED